MGSYGQEDMDEYEGDFIDDQDGDVGAGRYGGRYADEDEDEDEEEEMEEEQSEEARKVLEYRRKLKEQIRSQLRQENGGSGSKSQDLDRRPAMNNFGSFFGPSQPVIADRVVQESKALLESRHLAPKASTSQSNGKKVNMPSISGPKKGISRPPIVKQVKTKAQVMKQTRDYSFLLSDDADVPKPARDSGQRNKLASKPDARPAQVPAQITRPSGHSGRKVVNGYEQRKPHGTPQVCSTRPAPARKLTSDSRASGGSSDIRRQVDVRKQPQPTKQVGSSTRSGVVRPPTSKTFPPKRPLSSTNNNISMEKKASGASVGHVSKNPVPNGQRLNVDKSRASGVIRSRERDTSGQYNRDNRVLKKENVAASKTQIKPPKQIPLRADVGRDHSRMQKPHGQMSARNQSGGVKKDPINRKRRAMEVDDDDAGDYRSIIRNMFGYNKNRYRDDYDDDDDCMEAGFSDIQAEEKRSARIARKEDEEELTKILEEEKRDRLRREAKMRKKSQR